MSKFDCLPSIFDCDEFTSKSWPPYHNNWDLDRKQHMPVIFSFAYTPTGRVSKYWCSLSLKRIPSDKEISEWEHNGRPRLKKGYKWSKVYKYSTYKI